MYRVDQPVRSGSDRSIYYTAFWFYQPDLAGSGSIRCNGLGCIRLISPFGRVVAIAIFVVNNTLNIELLEQ